MNGVLQAAPDGCVHAAGVESLGQQVPVDPPGDGSVLNRRAVSQLTLEGLRYQRVFIEIPEDLGDGRPGQLAVDTERLDRAQRPPPAVALHVRLGPRAGERGAAVVERALLLQAGHRRVDLIGGELAARQPRPHLRFRQLAAGEQPEGGDVGVSHALRIIA